MDLRGKNILYIGPSFYNYHNEIVNEITTQGGVVDYFPEILNTFTYRFSLRYLKKYSKILEERYLDSILEQLKREYDYFFLIKGKIISDSFLTRLRIASPKAIFIMYQWDSYKNNPNYLNILPFFTKVMTFDMVDAEEKKLEYLPLFYTKEYGEVELNETRPYDISFIGSYHSDRLSVVRELDHKARKLKLNFFYYIYITKMGLILRIIKGEINLNDLKYFSTSSMTHSEIQDVYQKSYAILDIESYGQHGLTMRTFEVLGSKINLITTNKNITKEPFYNKENISLISRKKPELEMDFFIIERSSNEFHQTSERDGGACPTFIGLRPLCPG